MCTTNCHIENQFLGKKNTEWKPWLSTKVTMETGATVLFWNMRMSMHPNFRAGSRCARISGTA